MENRDSVGFEPAVQVVGIGDSLEKTREKAYNPWHNLWALKLRHCCKPKPTLGGVLLLALSLFLSVGWFFSVSCFSYMFFSSFLQLKVFIFLLRVCPQWVKYPLCQGNYYILLKKNWGRLIIELSIGVLFNIFLLKKSFYNWFFVTFNMTFQIY